MMRALDEVFSMQVLEIQGRANENGDIKWCLIFDTKGCEEKKLQMKGIYDRLVHLKSVDML